MRVVSHNVLAPQRDLHADVISLQELPVHRAREARARVAGGRHGRPLEVTACTRVFDEPRDGLWCSDRFGVAADLVAPTHPVGSTDTLVSGAPHER